jgi:Phosphoinositide phospholipase C, Ca2+-dependent
MGPHEMELLRLRNPKAADALSYAHPSLDVQLDRGIRQIELDIYADSKGGRYSPGRASWPRPKFLWTPISILSIFSTTLVSK